MKLVKFCGNLLPYLLAQILDGIFEDGQSVASHTKYNNCLFYMKLCNSYLFLQELCHYFSDKYLNAPENHAICILFIC